MCYPSRELVRIICLTKRYTPGFNTGSIFINDLVLICSDSSVHLYADDTAIYTSKPHLLQIQTALQSNFNTLQIWLLSNKQLLNKTKSYIVVFGTRQSLKTKSNNLIIKCNDGTSLHRVDQTKCLVLWIESELTFKPHINHILHKINFGTSVLFQSRDCFTLIVWKNLTSQLILPFCWQWKYCLSKCIQN